MRKILQYGYIATLFLLVLYIAFFVRSHPTHFVYTTSPNAVYTGGEPFLDCNLQQVGLDNRYQRIEVNGCEVFNVPIGPENIYVKESNPFIYAVMQNDLALVGLFVLIFILLFGVELQEKIVKLTSEANKE